MELSETAMKTDRINTKTSIGKRRERIFNIISGLILPALGTVIISVSIINGIKARNFTEHAKNANAVITDFVISAKTDERQTIIRYSAEGRTYTKAIKTYTTEMSRGDILQIKYLPDYPEKPYYTVSNPLKNILLAAAGTLIVGIGVTIRLTRRRKKMRLQKLIDTGIRIEAVITDIRQATFLSMEGMHPIIVSCRYIATDGRIYLFNSAPAWHRSYDINPRSKVPVYVDSRNPAHYYVDVDSVAD